MVGIMVHSSIVSFIPLRYVFRRLSTLTMLFQFLKYRPDRHDEPSQARFVVQLDHGSHSPIPHDPPRTKSVSCTSRSLSRLLFRYARLWFGLGCACRCRRWSWTRDTAWARHACTCGWIIAGPRSRTRVVHDYYWSYSHLCWRPVPFSVTGRSSHGTGVTPPKRSSFHLNLHDDENRRDRRTVSLTSFFTLIQVNKVDTLSSATTAYCSVFIFDICTLFSNQFQYEWDLLTNAATVGCTSTKSA